MKKVISIITLGTFLATSSLYAGKSIVAADDLIVAIPTQIDPNPFYVGVGVLWAGLSKDCFCPPDRTVRLKDSAWGGIIRAGYEYNQYWGIEARVLRVGVDTDWSGTTTHYGIFLKPMMPVGEQMNIYGLIGYGHTKISDCPDLRDEFTYDGFSYGIGFEYDLSDRESDREVGDYDRPFDGQADQEKGWGLWIDYQNLMNNEGPNNYKSNIVTFGVTYDF